MQIQVDKPGAQDNKRSDLKLSYVKGTSRRLGHREKQLQARAELSSQAKQRGDQEQKLWADLSRLCQAT